MIANEQNDNFTPAMMFYNKHYVRTDSRGCILEGWSDGPNSEKDTTNAICINNKGGYQFRLFPDGEENPQLLDWESAIPLYQIIGGVILRRAQADIEADRALIPPPPPSAEERMRADIDYIAVMADIEL